MKKIVSLAVISGVLGLALGLGMACWRRPAPALPSEMSADSLLVTGDSSLVLADSGAMAGLDSLAHDPDNDPVRADVNNAGVPAPMPAALSAGASLADADTAAAALARIFGAMKPAEAARVLQQLDDLSGRRVLAQLPDRKAAPILAALPQEKAAAIAVLLLQGRSRE